MTILVLEIKVPEPADGRSSNALLVAALLGRYPLNLAAFGGLRIG